MPIEFEWPNLSDFAAANVVLLKPNPLHPNQVGFEQQTVESPAERREWLQLEWRGVCCGAERTSLNCAFRRITTF